MRFRRALRDRVTARDPMTCMFSSGCGVCKQSSAATSGNALTPTFLTYTRCVVRRRRKSGVRATIAGAGLAEMAQVMGPDPNGDDLGPYMGQPE